MFSRRLFSCLGRVKRNLTFVVLLCVILNGVCLANAEAPNQILYAYPDQVVLTTKKTSDGLIDNPLVRLAEVVFERADIPWQSNQYPAARMFTKLAGGEQNFSILVNSQFLDDCCIVSRIPVTTTELRVYFKDNTPVIHLLDDLKHQRVITLSGYNYGALKKFLDDKENSVTRHPTASHESAFAMLKHDRAEYVLNYKHPSIEVLQKNPIPGIRYTTLRNIDLFLVLHKDYPNAEVVMKKLEAIVEGLDVAAILNLPTDSVYAVNDTY